MPAIRKGENEYTAEEQKEAVRRMRTVSDAFYGPATQTGCHAFIEFCGLMNEFIKVCETTTKSGGDFMMTNTHNDQPLVMEDYQAMYLAEKLDCIFGPTIRANPQAKKAFERWLLEGQCEAL